ncbi:PD-(D/E)XK motif protein [Acinetobacter kyonggiensis]|uniref:Putative PD-(D/E)XK family member n=1 Tax=Acinetobacter kyonggiensis TaxID=595670 RepID=A0A1H3HS90_9GAMM|nr:PD-(D/E)XK motif protein [Acinetobacter kyonggiensis]SDY18386.1 Putative PD-(D/E)XK family member [Acinetobacter kyonggiensis]
MHEDLSNRWSKLPLGSDESVFQLFDSTHPLRFYIGKSVENYRVLMLVVGSCPPKIKSMRAIKIKSYFRDDESWALVLTLDSPLLEPMFSLLCADLINFSNKNFISEDEALASVLRRLTYWRLLLERETLNLLSEREIRGLYGELLFLQKLFDKLGVNSALKSWVGPFDAPQDFQADECCWEIKTIRPSAIKILISSEFQLQVSKSPIYLVVIELIEALTLNEVNSYSINSLVEKIRSMLWDDIVASDLFEERLSHTGYSPRSEYDEFMYRVGDTSTYEVTEGFPCITSAIIATGVSKVRYEINISDCEKYLINTTNNI